MFFLDYEISFSNKCMFLRILWCSVSDFALNSTSQDSTPDLNSRFRVRDINLYIAAATVDCKPGPQGNRFVSRRGIKTVVLNNEICGTLNTSWDESPQRTVVRSGDRYLVRAISPPSGWGFRLLGSLRLELWYWLVPHRLQYRPLNLQYTHP